jgi:peptidoglycan/LPS O-acetylase OafA/YrhL
MSHPVPLASVLAKQHLPALDGLRAVAVGLVIAYHAGYNIPGDLGVTGFFVLSGFLITWLLLREYDHSGTISLRAFYLRRTLRIFPAYYAFVLFSLLTDFLLGYTWTAGQMWAALGYAVNYYNAFHNHKGPIPHAWSLAIEEQFYLCWPILMLILMRRGERFLRLTMMTLIVTILIWRSYLYLGLAVGSAYVYNAVDTRFDTLALGCLLATLLRHPRFLQFSAMIASRPWLPIVTAILIMWSRTGGSAAYHYSLGFTVDSLLIAILITQLLQLHTSVLWTWLDYRITRYLGALSYPLYLWHLIALAIGAKLFFLPQTGQAIAGVAAAIMLAAGSYHLLEQPILALKPRLQELLLPTTGRTQKPEVGTHTVSLASPQQRPADSFQ